MTNKYLTKIASLYYPELPHHEFDMAFEGGGNPTRERIIAAAKSRDRDRYRNDFDEWRDDVGYISRTRPEYLASHMGDMPAEHDYNHLGDVHDFHSELASRAGKAVPGPSTPGLAVGYGLGALGAGAGLAKRSIGMGLLGAGALAATGIYHHMAQPGKRHARFMGRVEELRGMKQGLLDPSDEDGVTNGR